MKLSEITNSNSDSIITTLELIKPKITQILSLYKGSPTKYFYHGSARNVDSYISKSPVDRSPRDTLVGTHIDIVRAMLRAGFIAHRGNSTFVSSARWMTTEYLGPRKGPQTGSSYIVFPFNGFNYTWSPHVVDLWRDHITGNISDQIIELGYIKTGLSDALHEENEVMIHGEYLAINYRHIKSVDTFIKTL